MKYLQGLFLFFTISFLSLSIEAQESNPLLNFDCIQNIDCVQQAIADDMDVNARTRITNKTPLHFATDQLFGDDDEAVSVIQALLDAGADVNAPNENNWMPLHFASDFGNANAAQVLINNGANVNTTTTLRHLSFHRGATSLHIALQSSSPGHLDVARILINNRADVNATTHDGQTPIMFTINSFNSMASFFNCSTSTSNSSLFCRRTIPRYVSILQSLLERGATPPEVGSKLHTRMTEILNANDNQ